MSNLVSYSANVLSNNLANFYQGARLGAKYFPISVAIYAIASKIIAISGYTNISQQPLLKI